MINASPKLNISDNAKELGYSKQLISESILKLCELNADFEKAINYRSINISFVSRQE